MTRPLSFKREAEADIDEAFDWYDARSESVAVGFLRDLDATLARIEANPFA